MLSASLDQQVKMYDLRDYSVVHSLRLDEPLLSVAVTADNTNIIAGSATGTLFVRTRAVTMEQVADAERTKPFAGTSQFFARGKNARANEGDFMVESKRKARLREYESLLRKFQYQAALDAALASKRPQVVVSLLQEFIHRGSLKIALAGRDETTLEPLVAFVLQYFAHPHYARLLIHVSNELLDVFAGLLGQSKAIDELYVKLHNKVKTELHFQKELHTVVGIMELLMSANQASAPDASAAQPEPLAGNDDDEPAAVEEAMDEDSS